MESLITLAVGWFLQRVQNLGQTTLNLFVLANAVPKMNELKKKYRNPQLGLTGKRPFIDVVSDSESDVEAALEEETAYNQYKPIRRKFKRYKFFVADVDHLWSADLMDMQNCSEDNDGIYYILVCVDTFSRFLRCQPVRRKTSVLMIEAFRKMFTAEHTPSSLFTDNGKEFKARLVQQYFEQHKVHHYTSKDGTVKAAHAERAIKTLRERLVRLYASIGRTKKWTDCLPDIVDHYNNTVSTVHGLAPAAVNHSNCLAVFKCLYPNGYSLPVKPPRYNVNDLVRISIAKRPLEKQTGKNYTDEQFQIVKVVPKHDVYMYELKSLDTNEVIDGKFYTEELVKIRKPTDDIYQVEKIISSKTDKRTREKLYLVKWQGYSASHNSWVSENDIER